MSTTTQQPRLADGRYTFKTAGIPVGDLEAEMARQRAEQMDTTGRIDATSLSRLRTGSRADFWRDALATAPIDINAPAPKIGMTINGVKTYQRAYHGGAGTLRMPAVAAMNRMADAHEGAFDIPVQAGNNHGHVTGWLRVRRSARGVWNVESIGMDEPYASWARRQASWVLGAERPTFALNQFGSHAEMAMEQDRLAGVEPAAVNSSAIQEVGYCERGGTVYVTTKDGSTYGYKATKDVYERMLTGSAGSIFARELAHKAEAVHAEQCPACGRFYSVTGGRDHDCPALRKELSTQSGGNDRGWAGMSLSGNRRRPATERVAALVAPFVRKAPVKMALGYDPTNDPTTRFTGMGGPQASRLADLLGPDQFSRTPAPGEILRAAARDENLTVTGRLDWQGLVVEEVRYTCDADTGQQAWEALRAAHALPTTDEPDRIRRGTDGTWRLWWASA